MLGFKFGIIGTAYALLLREEKLGESQRFLDNSDTNYPGLAIEKAQGNATWAN
jgi:hypothetical protein